MTHVRVEGLRELRRDLRRVQDTDQLRDVQQALRRAAGVVSDEAQMRANVFSFRLADTIRPGANSRGAYVQGGKAAYPWYGWADFGSRNPRSGQSRQTGPWAGSGKGPRGGRFIYPAIESKERQVVEVLEDGLAQALRRYEF